MRCTLVKPGIAAFAGTPRFFAAHGTTGLGPMEGNGTMDALSEALSTVRMTSAIFTNSVCTAPWGFAVPAMERMAPLLSPVTPTLSPTASQWG
jgi:hypothetical protein